MPSLKDVEALIEERKFDEAESLLSDLGAGGEDPAEVACRRASLLTRMNRWEEAIEAYEEALEADDQHTEAMFQLAYLLDMRGHEERAIELYEQCVADAPSHVNALINLAVLYEDAGQFDAAACCLDRILAEHPKHTRARLFRKDVESSKTMYYDEDQERVREKRNAIMDIPVSDFELSVRSRNCLKQMNIQSLGDLLNVTETQLMAYKNFGETSLNEIKAMLTQKGLHIGQGLEEATPEAALGTAQPTVGETGVYARPVSELELSVRSRKCLQRLGINSLGELVARTEADLLATKNFGQTSLNEIKRRLSELGLTLRSPN